MHKAKDLFDRLKSILHIGKSPERQQQVRLDTLHPDQDLVVIGDIHGAIGVLRDSFDRIDAKILAKEILAPEEPHVVFVGDYIDRGEQSAAVLQMLFELQRELDREVTCLMGNHERMMLDFIDDPVGRGADWLRNGGLQTLASYKIGGIREQPDVEELVEASSALETALLPGMLDWLRALPLQYRSGNVCVAHAGMDPHLAPEDQRPSVLLWGHAEFMTTPRDDGLWVVHGHTIVREPQIRPSRISIDTGAYHSGRLTVAMIRPGSCEFV